MTIYVLYHDGYERENLGYVTSLEEAEAFRRKHQKYKEDGEPYANNYFYDEVNPYDPQ